jgi:hypothetical protein
LILNLQSETWMRFSVWLAIGLVIYFSYGIRKSNERVRTSIQNKIFPCFESKIHDESYSIDVINPQNNIIETKPLDTHDIQIQEPPILNEYKL